MGQGLGPPTADLFLFTRSQPPPLPSRTDFFEATSKERDPHSSSSSSSSSNSFGHDGCSRIFAVATVSAAKAVYGAVSPCPHTVGPSTTRHSLAATDEQQPDHRWRTVTDDIRPLDPLSSLQGFYSDTHKMEFG